MRRSSSGTDYPHDFLFFIFEISMDRHEHHLAIYSTDRDPAQLAVVCAILMQRVVLIEPNPDSELKGDAVLGLVYAVLPLIPFEYHYHIP
jgi:hypothetical protein